MTKQEIQEKLLIIVEEHNAVNKTSGYKAGTDVRVAYFYDLVRMINALLETTDEQTNPREK